MICSSVLIGLMKLGILVSENVAVFNVSEESSSFAVCSVSANC